MGKANVKMLLEQLFPARIDFFDTVRDIKTNIYRQPPLSIITKPKPLKHGKVKWLKKDGIML